MPPPIPSNCDQCNKVLAKQLVCSKCKAFVFCSRECSIVFWRVHKFGCSPLPAGELAAKAVERGAEMDGAVEELTRLLQRLTTDWGGKKILAGAAGVIHPERQRAQDSVSLDERLALLRGPAFKALAAFSLPAAYVVEPYPGRPEPHADNFAHRLRLLQRFLFLYELSHMTPARQTLLLQLLDSTKAPHHFIERQMAAKGDLANPEPLTAGARLYGPKLLAVPGAQSAAEYASLAPWMANWAVGAGMLGHAHAWLVLAQVGQQCALCPELLDFVPE